MADFIVDMNIPTKVSSVGYPSYFFDDMNKSKKHHVFYGGTSYLKELARKESLQRLLRDWVTQKKASRVDATAVDEFESRLKARILEKCGECPSQCDDLHILALSAVTTCRNILSNDDRMAACRDKIRNLVGHDYCPDVKLIKTEAVYKAIL